MQREQTWKSEERNRFSNCYCGRWSLESLNFFHCTCIVFWISRTTSNNDKIHDHRISFYSFAMTCDHVQNEDSFLRTNFWVQKDFVSRIFASMQSPAKSVTHGFRTCNTHTTQFQFLVWLQTWLKCLIVAAKFKNLSCFGDFELMRRYRVNQKCIGFLFDLLHAGLEYPWPKTVWQVDLISKSHVEPFSAYLHRFSLIECWLPYVIMQQSMWFSSRRFYGWHLSWVTEFLCFWRCIDGACTVYIALFRKKEKTFQDSSLENDQLASHGLNKTYNKPDNYPSGIISGIIIQGSLPLRSWVASLFSPLFITSFHLVFLSFFWFL